MAGRAYYNEIDPYAAAWLRNLIAAGHVAPGDVDTRSIVDVRPADLAGYDQCHFFAGIGGWSYALRLAGWSDDRPVWTGSCPCQPFSAAGKRGGTNDPRHLWPEWFRLLRECRPATVLGEQVASRAGLGWFDAVSVDLEGADYAVGAADLCAASVGAPHIRQRLWFVADAAIARRCWFQERDAGEDGRTAEESRRLRDAGSMGDAGREGLPAREREALERAGRGEEGRATLPFGPGSDGCTSVSSPGEGNERERVRADARDDGGHCFWTPCDWIPCRDGKARPVEPGTFPLDHGVPCKVGRLRAYGNAIVPQVASAFVRAAMGALGIG